MARKLTSASQGSLPPAGDPLAEELKLDEPPDAFSVEEEVVAAAAAVHLDEGRSWQPVETADDLTPETLLGGHRDARGPEPRPPLPDETADPDIEPG